MNRCCCPGASSPGATKKRKVDAGVERAFVKAVAPNEKVSRKCRERLGCVSMTGTLSRDREQRVFFRQPGGFSFLRSSKKKKILQPPTDATDGARDKSPGSPCRPAVGPSISLILAQICRAERQTAPRSSEESHSGVKVCSLSVFKWLFYLVTHLRFHSQQPPADVFSA